ncbi:phosphopantetheine-binding protein [Jatrophihabitans sp.]|uniref:phosphopantetheine-binding protein n=1 Tax=Jatrophihabitans sp. TaxID=1932789 RepID=UPI002B8E45A2|nr:acyl carrier protein [Jatrophihabitans sp.]
MSSTLTLTQTIARLVAHASAGSISEEQAARPGTNLSELGLSSLDYLKLIDAVELELGVFIDLEGDLAFMTSVQGIADYVSAQRAL